MITIKNTSFAYDYDFWCTCDCMGKPHYMSLTDITDDEIRDGTKRLTTFICNHCLGKVTVTMIVETRHAVCVDISNA